MTEPSHPRARLSFETGDFADFEGFPHFLQTSVMPVVAVRGDIVRPLGTCFAISSHGICLTAKHVIDDAVEFDQQSGFNELRPDDWTFGAVYASRRPGDTADYLGGILPMHRVHMNPTLDIAIMSVSLPTNTETGETLQTNPVLLSPGIPATRQRCMAIGYHSMEWRNETALKKVVNQKFSRSRGTIEEIHFPRRDSVLRNYPCFRTSVHIPGGMSGGPVLSASGQVCGVVCSSYELEQADEGAISYASLVGPVLGMQIDVLDNGTERKVFVHELIEVGTVRVDGSYASVRIRQTSSELTVDFGDDRKTIFQF